MTETTTYPDADMETRAKDEAIGQMAYRLRQVLQRRGISTAAALHDRLTTRNGASLTWAGQPKRRTVERHFAGDARITAQDLAAYISAAKGDADTLAYVITGETDLASAADPGQNSALVARVVRIVTSFIPSAVVHVESQYLSPRLGVERGRFVIVYEDTLRLLRDPARDVDWQHLHYELTEAGAEPQHQILRRAAHTQRLRSILGLEPIEVRRTTRGAREIAEKVRPPLMVIWVPGLTRTRPPATTPYRLIDKSARLLVVLGYADMFGPSIGPLIADGLGWGYLDLDRSALRLGQPVGDAASALLSDDDLARPTIVGTRRAETSAAVLQAVLAAPETAKAQGVQLLLPRLLRANLLCNIERDDRLIRGDIEDAVLGTALHVRGPVLGRIREHWRQAAALLEDSRLIHARNHSVLWEIDNLPWVHYGTTRERSEAGASLAATCIGWLAQFSEPHATSTKWTQLVHEDPDGNPYPVPRSLWTELESSRSVGVLHRDEPRLNLPAPEDGERRYTESSRRHLPYQPMTPHVLGDGGATGPTPLPQEQIGLATAAAADARVLSAQL